MLPEVPSLGLRPLGAALVEALHRSPCCVRALLEITRGTGERASHQGEKWYKVKFKMRRNNTCYLFAKGHRILQQRNTLLLYNLDTSSC